MESSHLSPIDCNKLRISVHWLIILGVLIALSGCVRRRLTVRTNPPGAMVYVDHQRIGTTPVSTNYVYYGTRQFEIIKDGYKTEKFLRRFNPPWYEFPGLDFIAESLWPYEIRDERVVDVQMSADVNVPTETLIRSGEELRNQATRGFVVGQPPTNGLTPEQLVIPTGQTPFNVDLTSPPGSPTSPLLVPSGQAPTIPNTPSVNPPMNGPLFGNPEGAVLPPGSSFFENLPSSIPSTNVTPGSSYRPPINP